MKLHKHEFFTNGGISYKRAEREAWEKFFAAYITGRAVERMEKDIC